MVDNTQELKLLELSIMIDLFKRHVTGQNDSSVKYIYLTVVLPYMGDNIDYQHGLHFWQASIIFALP